MKKRKKRSYFILYWVVNNPNRISIIFQSNKRVKMWNCLIKRHFKLLFPILDENYCIFAFNISNGDDISNSEIERYFILIRININRIMKTYSIFAWISGLSNSIHLVAHHIQIILEIKLHKSFLITDPKINKPFFLTLDSKADSIINLIDRLLKNSIHT